jgi:hypothetical protein
MYENDKENEKRASGLIYEINHFPLNLKVLFTLLISIKYTATSNKAKKIHSLRRD